ncbi:MAG TPA: VOC family protein [Acidimicrobiales bacterium]|nr:VOC family protein [Acidimicrobiales bacterium]
MLALDHVQLAMPAGREADAEDFYVRVLGMEVVPKPEPLASRGGRWFVSGSVQIHLGVDPDFRPARKAHPAIVVDDLDGFVAGLAGSGTAWTDDRELPGVRRGYVADPFGNRIEVIAAD